MRLFGRVGLVRIHFRVGRIGRSCGIDDRLVKFATGEEEIG